MALKTLHADFDAFTDGDTQFKHELIGSMISNLQELNEALHTSVAANDFAEFRQACHKTTSTVDILADAEFKAVIASLKADGSNAAQQMLFHTLCGQIIESLEAEQLKKDNE